MNKPFLLVLAIALTFAYGSAVAQSYEFRHGYIFDQGYVKRISVNQAEKIANIPVKYIKSIPGYHIIGVEYGHDQPQLMLVSESGSHIYFVNTN